MKNAGTSNAAAPMLTPTAVAESLRIVTVYLSLKRRRMIAADDKEAAKDAWWAGADASC